MSDATKNFEAKLAEAEKILAELNSEKISLEESVKLFGEGKKLLADAQKILENAKLNITEVGGD